jgi:DNA polymerase III epsilon subunit-like protein
LIVLDVETTGLDPRRNSLFSIGAVDFDHPSRFYYAECRVPDDAEVAEGSLRITGETERHLRNPTRPPIGKLVGGFLRWSQRCNTKTLAGENPSFDAEFLKAALGRLEIPWAFGYRYVDLHSICYADFLRCGLRVPTKKKLDNISLDVILAHVGLRRRRKYHDALNDAKLETEALSRLIYRRPAVTRKSKKTSSPLPLQTDS